MNHIYYKPGNQNSALDWVLQLNWYRCNCLTNRFVTFSKSRDLNWPTRRPTWGHHPLAKYDVQWLITPYHSSKICTTAKVPNNINMKKREIEHIEDCCSLKEHRKCWANYDHRIDTINSCRSKIHRSGEVRSTTTWTSLLSRTVSD